MKTIKFKEDFFHYLWKTKSFNFLNLTTATGEVLELLNFGTHNHNAGPDFLNASVHIDDQLWVGNIEIHINSSDWYKHGHHLDPAYNAVILHVSYEHDKEIVNANGQIIPCLVLKNRISKQLIENYAQFLEQKTFIPCESFIEGYDKQAFELYKEQLIVERLEYKSKTANRIYHETNGNWLETMYRLIARSLGANINQDAFETLARVCPLNVLLKYRDNANKVMALLFGQAGMLCEPQDGYTKEMLREYEFLARKHNLQSMNLTSWKYMRMRPDNFPDLRIAWLAELIKSIADLFDHLIHNSERNEVVQKFKLQLPAYWDNRYLITKTSSKIHPKLTSLAQINRIIINAVVPFKFLYAQKMDLINIQIDAIGLLRNSKVEKNKHISSWKNIGISSNNALDSQALLHLYQNYCKFDRCLRCKVGHSLIQNKN